MRRLSILHLGKFYPPDSGGMETHLRDLAVRQAAVARVSVIAASSARHHESGEVEGVSVTRVPRIATIASMPVCPGLSAAIRRSPADIVHVHMPNPGAALAFLLSGHTGRVVITHHADTMGRKILRQFSDPIVRQLMRRADRIIVTSKRYLWSSEELMPYREKCRVVPLGIDVEQAGCADSVMVQKLRSEFGERFILAVGRLVPYKGFDILIRAMKKIDAKLILIGKGPEFSSLSGLAVREGVQHKVILLGQVKDVRPYFAAAGVLALPSVTRAEAFGIVQLEAMAAGVPVVNTDIDSGVPEISPDGVTGITVPPGDTDSLAHALKTLLSDSESRSRMGDAGRDRARMEFSVEQMAKRTMEVYGEILDAGA